MRDADCKEFENKIRQRIARGMLEESKMPISLKSGAITFTGDLSLRVYQDNIGKPTVDDHFAFLYLIFKENRMPEFAKLVAVVLRPLYDLKEKKAEAVKEQDFDRAAKLRDEINSFGKKLLTQATELVKKIQES